MARRRRFRLWRWVIGLTALAVVLAAGAVAYWWFSDSAPAPVSLESAVVAASEQATGERDAGEQATAPTTTTSTTTPSTTGEPTTTDVGTTDAGTTDTTLGTAEPEPAPSERAIAEADELAGVWDVATDGPESFAGYRLQEVLANIGDKTVVGRTNDVAATLEFANVASGDATQGQLTRAEVAVQTATLKTDNSHRDGHARESLAVSTYPEATFTLTEPVVLVPDGGLVAAPDTWNGDVVGDLTIKGVTRATTFAVDASLEGDVLVVVGRAPITFADFEVELPSARIVLSIEESGTMEFQLYLKRTTTAS